MPQKLGQHFLINKSKLRKIAEALDLKPKEVVIEIGPGHGELTKNLKSPAEGEARSSRSTRVEAGQRRQISNLKIIAVEKDFYLAENLQKKFASDKNIKIIQGDILKVLPRIIHNSLFIIQNYKIVGNIPYYITGHLLRIISEIKNKPLMVIMTIQKEVAERIIAVPPKMNLLAASVQFWAEPEIVGYISKKDFRPMPKVDSAIIKLKVKREKGKEEGKKYYQLIKALFKQPRKTILNNLAAGMKYQVLSTKNRDEIIKKLTKADINPQNRPQDLNIKQIKKLSKLFKDLGGKKF